MKNSFTETYEASKVFHAPLDFVYAWCTDFREDDPKMVGSSNRRHILERTKKRVVWAVEKKGKPLTDPIRVVWLAPPDSWHLETCGDGSEVGDYKLTAVGPSKTRLDMKFLVTYSKKDEVETKESWNKDTKNHWDSYARHLEKDYARSPR
jgi:hypothetical protein